MPWKGEGQRLAAARQKTHVWMKQNPCEMVRLQGAEIKKMEDFKYLWSTVQSNGEWKR